MSKSVFCTASAAQTEAIMRQLKNSGFSGNDISVLMADKAGTRDFAHEHNTKAPEGTATGVGTGVVLGGALGWLAGIGALAIPGLGPFIAAGPIMAALSGAAVVGTLGGITGARWNGHSRVRSQAFRRQGQVWKFVDFHSLRRQ